MNIELEKNLIIEEIHQVNEEWLLIAIKRLLGLDYQDVEIPEEHKRILDHRIRDYESVEAKTIEWEELKRQLSQTR